MSRSAYFEGGDLSPTDRDQARKAAMRVQGEHPDLAFNHCWSAAAFLIRSGQELTDDEILAEARKREGNQRTADAFNRERAEAEARR